MATLLQINTSLFSEAGQSSKLAAEFVARWTARNPDGRVIVRDLAREPLPHLDAERFTALITPADKRTPAQAAVIAQSDALIEEIKAADEIVLGLPMYNFGVPSQLKAYFDHIARAGVTFRYTAQGPEGLLPDVKTTVIATRGGYFAGTPADSETNYVRDFLAFLGLRNVAFVYAEGLNIGPEQKAQAIDKASAELARIAA